MIEQEEADGIPDQTRVVSLYKIVDDRDFDTCWRTVDPDDAHEHASITVGDLGDGALLVFGEKQPRIRDWVPMLQTLTGHDLGYTTSDPSAILFIRVGPNSFALTFGGGFRLLVDSAVNRDFGLDFAMRVLDVDAVRRVTRQYLSARARVDINAVPGGEALWSFGIREHAEMVRQLTGAVLSAARLDLSHSRRTSNGWRRRITVDCADRIRLPPAEHSKPPARRSARGIASA